MKSGFWGLSSFFALLCIHAQGAPTLEEWRGLSAWDKVVLVQEEKLDYVEMLGEDIKDPTLRTVVGEMTRFILENTQRDNIENELYVQESIFLIGEPRLNAIDLISIEETPVAISLYLTQVGGATFSGLPPKRKRYSSLEEVALDKDLDPRADVSWSLISLFEFDGQKWELIEWAVWGAGWEWTGW